MATLTVGTGAQYEYHTIAAAVAASQSGDTIDVQAGTYTNDFVDTSKSLSLQAIGGVVKMVATQPPPDQKAIITEGAAGGSFSITGFDISGAAISAAAGGNGAGIRYQGGSLTLNNDYIHNNQDGMLAAADPNGSITIDNSEFAYNGSGTGKTHNLYVNDVQQLTIENSYFHDANVGHEIKSRAENTVITNSRIFDNQSTASYSIDLPNGGNAVISNDTIEQGPNSQNPAIISYGEEGSLHAGTSVSISQDTIVNDKSGTAYGVVNSTSTPVTVSNDKVYGLTSQNLTQGPAAVSSITYLTSRPTLDTSSHWQPQDPPAAGSVAGQLPDPGGILAPLTGPLLGNSGSPSFLGSGRPAPVASDPSPAASNTQGIRAADGGNAATLQKLAGSLKSMLADLSPSPGSAAYANRFLMEARSAAAGITQWGDALRGQGALAMAGFPHAAG